MASSTKTKKSGLRLFIQDNKSIINFILAMIGILVLLTILQPYLLRLLQQNPEMYETYRFVESQLGKNSLLWLFMISFIGSLFFVTIPTDFFYFYYLLAGANIFSTTIVYFLGVTLGRIVDYWIGYIFSGFVIKHVIKKNEEEFNRKFGLWGSNILFFGNLIPFFPLEFFAAFVGTLKLNFWKFLLYNCLGKIVKLLLLVILIKYFMLYNIGFLNFNFFDFVKNMLEMLLPAARP